MFEQLRLANIGQQARFILPGQDQAHLAEVGLKILNRHLRFAWVPIRPNAGWTVALAILDDVA